MQFASSAGRNALVGAILAWCVIVPPTSAQVPEMPLPAAFHNVPPEAPVLAPRDPAFGEADLARLITLARGRSTARSQLEARLRTLRSGTAADIERRFLDAELARVDDQVAEETAHAWLDARAAAARTSVATDLVRLAQQVTELARARLAAGLAAASEADRAAEQSFRYAALAERFEQERRAAATRLGLLTGETPPRTEAPESLPPFSAPIRAAAPAVLLRRPEVRAARVRLESREASAAELEAAYRETVQKALEDAEGAFAAAVSAAQLRTAAGQTIAAAERQVLTQQQLVDAGRAGRVQLLDAQIAARRAQLGRIDADHAYARALTSLERALGR